MEALILQESRLAAHGSGWQQQQSDYPPEGTQVALEPESDDEQMTTLSPRDTFFLTRTLSLLVWNLGVAWRNLGMNFQKY